MNLVVWLVVGALVGWLASLLMRAGSVQSTVFDVTVGLVGAFLGGLFVAPATGVGPLEVDALSPAWLAVAVAGAALLLVAAHLLRRAGMRR
jgi:uncharacterized membrane protein YeaQ/YmgE (transglycosylase-associated protein family)